MAVPRTGFVRSLDALYNFLDSEIPANQPRSNNLFWVSSVSGAGGVDDVNHGTFTAPYATVAYALTACVAGRGDRIIVKAGHAEAISDATSFALSKSGVEIFGLGTGSLRPTFTLGTLNTATIPVTAAGIRVRNCVFVANFLSIAACFTLTAAPDFTVEQCLFRDTSSVLNFLTIIGVAAGANGCDGLTFNDNVVKNLGVTSNNTTINSGATIDRLQACRNNLDWAVQNDKPGLIDVTTGILTRCDIGDNHLYRPNTTTAGGSLIKLTGTTSTGWVYRNFVQTLTTTSDLLFTTTVGLAAFENRVSGAVGATGFVIPAVDS